MLKMLKILEKRAFHFKKKKSLQVVWNNQGVESDQLFISEF